MVLKRKNKWISLKKSKPLPEHMFQLVNASVYGIIYPEREESGFRLCHYLFMNFLIRLFMTFILSLLLTPLVKLLAFRIGAYDAPGERRINTKNMPTAGGLAHLHCFC